MTEQELFLAAVEMTDLQRRDRYLEQACAGNLELRRQVEALLKAHAAADDFLSTPAVHQMSPKSTAIDGDKASPAEAAEQEHTQRFGHESAPGEDNVSLGFLTPSDQPGSLGRLGHYEVHEVLGHGAFGIVLKAFDEKLHRLVAIKVLSPELAATSPPRKRFLREARAAAAIRHEHVVSVYAVEEQPIPYLVMEYIPGLTLHQTLNEHGPLDVADVLRLGQQIAEGLAAAHARGLIHRDIKPTNILLENGLTGRVKITDFGLARAADDASQTQSGTIAGTPMYMSPEQATTGQIDQRSDLFSLGSVLYVMVSGRPPFRAANTLAVLKRVVEDMPRPIREIIADVPGWLCAIIAKLQEKKPEDRFASAQEVADLLGRCLADVQANRPVELPEGVQVDIEKREETAGPVERLSASESSSPLSPASGESVRERGRTGLTARPWLTVAAIAILLLIALEITGLTGVTNLVLHRQSANTGTLVIEDDDSETYVTITPRQGEWERLHPISTTAGDKEERTLPPGTYVLTEYRRGEKVSQRFVTLVAGGKEVVQFTMESDQREKPLEMPGVDFETERQVAEYVISKNGSVAISDGSRMIWFLPGNKPLPQAKFFVAKIALDQRLVTDADLPPLLPAKNLQLLKLGQTNVTEAGVQQLAAALPKCRIEWDGGVIEPRISDDPDRRAAEWVLSIGGMIRIRKHREEHDIKSVVDLPAGAFQLLCMDLYRNPKVTDLGLDCFKDCTNLTKLQLSGTPVSDAGLAYFKDCRNLTHLHLFETHVSDVGLAYFKDCKNLTSLHVGLTQVTDAGLAHFKDCKYLTDLDLWGVQLTDAGLVHFKECKNLMKLILTNTQATDTGLAYFKDCKDLTYLHLFGTHATDIGLAHFRNCKNLRSLHLGETGATDAGLALFKDCTRLTELDMYNLPVSDAGLAVLSGHSRLLSLTLNSTQITDDGLQILQTIPMLKEVILLGTNVTAAGVKKLAAALPNCRIEWDGGVIEPTMSDDPDRRAAQWVLSMGGKIQISRDGRESEIGSADDLPSGEMKLVGIHLENRPGVEEGDLARFRDFTTLTSLHLGAMPIGDAGLENFRNCRELKHLYLSGTNVTDAGLAHFQKCRSLQSLFLRSTKVSDAGLAHFKDCKQLVSLYLGNTAITDAGLAHLGAQRHLVDLNLSGPLITDAGLLALQQGSALKAALLSGTRVTDRSLKLLERMPQLSVAELKQTDVTAAGITQLAAALPRCRIVWDGGVIEPREADEPSIPEPRLLTKAERNALQWVVDNGGRLWTTLGQTTRMEDLPVDQAVGIAGSSARLQILSLNLKGPKVIDEALDTLVQLPPVGHFEILQCPLSDAGLTRLLEAPVGQTAQGLILSELPISRNGLAAVRTMRNLKFIQFWPGDVLDAATLREWRSLPLTRLEIKEGKFGLEHFQAVARMERMEWLQLDRVGIDDAGFRELLALTNLTQLTLVCDKPAASPDEPALTDDGIKDIGKFAKLTYANLRNHSVTDDGLQALAACENLEKLLIAGTNATEAGVKELAAKLPKCRIEWDGGVIEPTMTDDADRRAAEWAHSAGISVTVHVAGQSRTVNAGDSLPVEPFELRFVDFRHPKITADALSHFSGCRHLRALNLTGKALLQSSLAAFKDCKQLERIELEHMDLTDAGLRHFEGCRNVIFLNLTSSPGVTDAGLAAFRDCRDLRTLWLTQTQVSDAGLAQLLLGPEFSQLVLAYTKVTDAGLVPLRNCPKLEVLNLTETQVSDAGMENFRDCRGLTQLQLANTRVTDAGLANFRDCRALRHLALDNLKVTEAGLAHFRDLPELEQLTLAGTQVTDAGLEVFAGCRKLQYVTLDSLPITDTGLAHLRNCRDLTHLHISQTRVTDAGLAFLADCPRLGRLGAMETAIGDEGLQSLKNCKDIYELQLTGSRVSDAGVPLLKNMNRLAYLSLARTRVTPAKIDELKAALPRCRIEWDGGVIEPR